MLAKILVANRGEIACRVIATARRLSIKTVAVYSSADASAKHVALADEAILIGPAPVAESYLKADVIIAAAIQTRADAIHPGYGFLSENAEFARAVNAAGLRFVGPPVDAIQAMGLKDAAKVLMERAGVPVVPGYHGSEQNPQFLAEQAALVGYPVLIKARAGGGGKGMRRVDDPADFAAALAGAQREGQASFADPVCLIEKFIAHPRHIEIQVFADCYGNVVHLFERDCSLQRRHQKVIEEAPAPDMPESLRAAMGAAAVEAAHAIGYQGAGTVEFIVDGSTGLRADGFWFMEMNTRLQVEHPVTEAITGLDLVALQLQVAAGEPLPFTQNEISINGWAFEARIYAEDVAKGFLPATGVLEHLHFPPSVEFEIGECRVDSGVRPGDAITPYYDPMIAKLIVSGPDRQTALARLAAALSNCRIAGAVTNIEFLRALAVHPEFVNKQIDTGLIERNIDNLAASVPPEPRLIALASIAALGILQESETASPDPWDSLNGVALWARPISFVRLIYQDQPVESRVEWRGAGLFHVESELCNLELRVAASGANNYTLTQDGHQSHAQVVRTADRVVVFSVAGVFSFAIEDLLAAGIDNAPGGDAAYAPMPGLVTVLSVGAGDAVVQGQALLVLEAMKMEHAVVAPRDGIVSDVLVIEGEQVADGALLVTLHSDCKARDS